MWLNRTLSFWDYMIEGEIGVDPFGEDKPRHLGEEVFFT